MQVLLVLLALVVPAAPGPPAFGQSASDPAASPPGAQTQTNDFETARAELRKALVQRLLGLATWCHDQQVFQERDVLYRQVLALDTDNPDARKGLRFARYQDGTWKEPAPRPAKNLNAKALALVPEKRKAVIAPYRDGLLELIARDPAAGGKASAVYQEILLLDPEDEVVHARLGDVQVEGKWMLAESARGKVRRPALREIVKTALAAPFEPGAAAAKSPESAWADAWSCGVQAPHLRVLGAAGATDCEALARILEGAVGTFGALFQLEPKPPADFDFYLLPGPARAQFLERNPNLDADRKRLFETAPGGGIPGGCGTALFESEPQRRNDCAVRNALGQLLRIHFNIGLRNGWVWEGLGLYLTRELVGTRLTWFVLAAVNPEPLQKGLLVPESNWMDEGLKLLTAANATPLATVLDKPVETMTVPDMVVGYVFAAYLIEGWPDKAAEFLARTGANAGIEATSGAVLGLSMEDLKEHLVRWLKERR